MNTHTGQTDLPNEAALALEPFPITLVCNKKETSHSQLQSCHEGA